MAKKIAKTRTFEGTVDTIKSTFVDANGFLLETTDDLVDTAITSGEKWQNVTAKAIKGGFKVAGQQQDLVFTALEALKAQLKTGSTRMKEMIKSK